MGMSTRVIGFVSAEGIEYKKHANVLRACAEAGIKQLPEETAKFFGSHYPSLDLLDEVLEVEIPVHIYADIMQEGFEVIVSEIPPNVHKIRFVNSY